MAGVDVLDGDSDVVDPSEQGRQVYAAGGRSSSPLPPSTRRISAIAASPTSSCSGVGSLVASGAGFRGRGCGRPLPAGSPWWRSLQANISTAIEAPPRPTAGAGGRARVLDQPLQQQRAAGREQHHRHDQVGAAAVVLLGHRGDVLDVLLVGGDRLVLDAVVGGEVTVAERDERRERRRSPARSPRAAPRPAPAGAAARSAPGSRRRRPPPASPRRAAAPRRSRRRASGSTAIASASFSGPRRPGIFATRLGGQLRLALGGDLDLPVAVAHRRRPVGRPVDQQPVAERHPAEAQAVGLSSDATLPTIGDRPNATVTKMRGRRAQSTRRPLPPV